MPRKYVQTEAGKASRKAKWAEIMARRLAALKESAQKNVEAQAAVPTENKGA